MSEWVDVMERVRGKVLHWNGIGNYEDWGWRDRLLGFSEHF